MVKLISCVTSCCGNRCKALSTHYTCLVNIILMVAEIITDKWLCFTFWHLVFVFGIFSCSFWIRTNVIGGSLRMHNVCHVPLKLDELICLLHRRPCNVTIVYTYIAMAMLKYISCSSTVELLYWSYRPYLVRNYTFKRKATQSVPKIMSYMVPLLFQLFSS